MRILIIFLVLNFNSFATTYFVNDLEGNDTNSGNSPLQAWKSIDRINQMIFQPGDSILFRRGGNWTGNLMPKGSGTKNKPIVVDAYGNGPLPVIDAKGIVALGELISNTIKLFNQEYWEFRNLRIQNFKPFETPVNVESEGKTVFSNSAKTGILVEGCDYGAIHHLYFTGLEICNINGAMQTKDNGGIFMNITWNENLSLQKETWFEDVIVQNCYFHEVDRTGFSNTSVWWNRSRDSKWGDKLKNGKIHNWVPSKGFIIRNNRFEKTGANALIVRVADAPLIEYNFFRECAIKGSGNASFPFNCDNVLFQYNEASFTVYNTEADSWDGKKDADAGGFDSDWNCKNTIIQYNYSHDNGFGGVLICCDGGSKTGFNDGTVLRYNIFENNFHHIIRTSGPTTNSKIYNNLFYSGKELDSVMMVFHKSWSGFSDSTSYLNNIFISHGKGCYFNTGKSTRNFFSNNLYSNVLVNGLNDSGAILADPQFVNDNDITGWLPVLKFLLKAHSPAIDAGLKIDTFTGNDFIGKPINNKPDIGPFEYYP